MQLLCEQEVERPQNVRKAHGVPQDWLRRAGKGGRQEETSGKVAAMKPGLTLQTCTEKLRRTRHPLCTVKQIALNAGSVPGERKSWPEAG